MFKHENDEDRKEWSIEIIEPFRELSQVSKPIKLYYQSEMFSSH